MRWILCLLMFASLGFAPAPVFKPNKNERDLEKLQGTWRSAAFRVGGRNIDMKATWKFHNGDIDIEMVDCTLGACYRVDTKSSPKTIEVKSFGKTLCGRILYKFEGDSLIVCYDEGFMSTPGAFGGEQTGRSLVVFEKLEDELGRSAHGRLR